MIEMVDEAAERRLYLFEPCVTKGELHEWIRAYLGIDFPDCTVDPASNSNPMDMIWQVYSGARATPDDDTGALRILAYASRTSFKTLAAAVLEVLSILHLGRDVGHMAAIEGQAAKAQSYVKEAFRRPYIRDFVIGDNQRMLQLLRYYNPETRHSLTAAEYAALSKDSKSAHIEYMHSADYAESAHYVKIVICSMQGSNSDHVPFFCVGGDTRIKARACDDVRQRKSFTARGIFRRLSGLSAGGRSGGETESVIETSAGDVELLSLNQSTGLWEFQPVVSASRSYRDTLVVGVESGRLLVVGVDHPFLVVGKGFTTASELAIGDSLVAVGKTHSFRPVVKGLHQAAEYRLNGEALDRSNTDDWDQVVLGSLLGDASISKKPQNNPNFYENHGIEQKQYMDWKRNIIAQRLRTVDTKPVSGFTGQSLVGFRTGNSPLLLPYMGVRSSMEGVERLGPLGLAVWYMDDGCKGVGFRISSESFTKDQNNYLAGMLKRRFGISVQVKRSYTGDDGRDFWMLVAGVEAKRRLSDICAPHIHPDLAYKFDCSGNRSDCSVCGRTFWFYDSRGRNTRDCGAVICRLLIQQTVSRDAVLSVAPGGKRWVYDFTLAANYNYVSDGVLSHNCIDEVDVVANPSAFQEAKSIAAGRDGMIPVTLMISTRKSSAGLVQKEIDGAAKSGLQVLHWNTLDVTRRCEPERHRPDLPRLTVYRSHQLLNHVSEAGYTALTPKQQESYSRDENVMGGCAKCRLYPMCRGNLATRQTSESPLLRRIATTIADFADKSLDYAHAQLLCDKPSQKGKIYARFDKTRHVLTPAQCYEKVFGEPPPEALGGDRMTKVALVALLVQRGVEWSGGMDFGDSHEFAAPVGFKDGPRAFLVRCPAGSQLDPDQQIEVCQPFKHLHPSIYPDPSNPGMIRMFKKNGFTLKKWNKGAGTVAAGISAMQAMLSPILSPEPNFYIVVDYDSDPEMDHAIDQIQDYSWATNAQGEPTGQPLKKDDDVCDGVRYWIQNVFGRGGGVALAPDEPEQAVGLAANIAEVAADMHAEAMQRMVSNAIGVPFESSQRQRVTIEAPQGSGYQSYYADAPAPTKGSKAERPKGRRGSLVWDI